MLKKRFYKTKCKVTFELPQDIEGVQSASVAGDFNDWDAAATPLKKLKSGAWKVTVDLEKDSEYQFRYQVNGSDWHNDDGADKYVPNNIDGDNSVVSTSQG